MTRTRQSFLIFISKKMNHLLALMLAYSLVSVGSVVLSMRASVSHLIGLMSVLYAFITIGLVLFLVNLVQTMPSALAEDLESSAGGAQQLAAGQNAG